MMRASPLPFIHLIFLEVLETVSALNPDKLIIGENKFTSGNSETLLMHNQGKRSSACQNALLLSLLELKRNANVYPLLLRQTKEALPSRLPVCHQLFLEFTSQPFA